MIDKEDEKIRQSWVQGLGKGRWRQRNEETNERQIKGWTDKRSRAR